MPHFTCPYCVSENYYRIAREGSKDFFRRLGRFCTATSAADDFSNGIDLYQSTRHKPSHPGHSIRQAVESLNYPLIALDSGTYTA